MAFQIAIRNNATGEVRLCNWDGEWDYVAEYDWTDGNNGCDCNLAGNFHSDGEEFVETCGETAYTPLYALLPNGSRVELRQPPNTPASSSSDPDQATHC